MRIDPWAPRERKACQESALGDSLGFHAIAPRWHGVRIGLGMNAQSFPSKAELVSGKEYAFACNVHDVEGPAWRIGGSMAIHFDATSREYVARVWLMPRDAAKASGLVWADYMPESAYTEERYTTYSRAKSMAAYWRQKVRYSAQLVAHMPL